MSVVARPTPVSDRAPRREAPAFGQLLKSFRAAQRLSQEELAGRAEISPRHLSFLETGRAQPSREMVLVLGSALDLPLRDRNMMLGAAGFVAVYRESELDSHAMDSVRRALDHLLRHHEPFPAVVVDGGWDVRRINEGAMRVFGALFAGHPLPTNLVHALFDPVLRGKILNFDEVTSILVQRLHREAALAPPGSKVRALIEQTMARADLPSRLRTMAVKPVEAVVPLHLQVGGLQVRFFTTITTLGTPIDVTAEEVRIESYFPMDDATDAWVRSLAA